MRLRPALTEAATVLAIVALCAALLLAWRYLLGAGLLAAAWRFARTGRAVGDGAAAPIKRPSRFAENASALALLHASWQLRRLGR